MQTLAEHLKALKPADIIATNGKLDKLITAPFTENASDVEAGGVFIARTGRNTDGHRFIPQALANGAGAIISEHALSGLFVPTVQVRDAQSATGYLAASFYGFPSRELVVIGVTGTDGKTTTSTLIYNLIKAHFSHKVGLISTIAADFGDKSVPTGLHVTTPSAPEVQAFLAQMRDAGLTHVVLEMTSHGLAQGRLNGVDVDIAVMTNVTHEHLDYHGTWENYRNAKGILFDLLGRTHRKPNQPKLGIVNADDPSLAYFSGKRADKIITYGIASPADYHAQDVQFTPEGTRFTLNGTEPLHAHLYGMFNVSNMLAAVAVARALGIANIQAGLESVRGVSGRMESIDEGQAFVAMVDFAHTPNALKNALETARTLIAPEKRVIAVFGSAGLRDVEKRRLMAEVSAETADVTVLTAEDPRTESLDSILQMMADGCISKGGIEGQTFVRIPDRGRAIYEACQMANTGDIVMVCGKGHEQSMCFGTVEHDWDDRDALRAALRGAPLATLPTAKG